MLALNINLLIKHFTYIKECNSLTNITVDENTISIPYGVTSIENYTFNCCSNLKSITLPSSITIIGDFAFYVSSNFSDVYYSGTKNEWKKIDIGRYNWWLADPTIHYHYENHSYNQIITEPSCTDQGYTTYICECGDSYIDDYVDANGHTYNAVITTPTFTTVMMLIVSNIHQNLMAFSSLILQEM